MTCGWPSTPPYHFSMKPEAGKLYRVLEPQAPGFDEVVAYDRGRGMWKIPAGEFILVLEYPTRQRLPNFSGGSREQWCDAVVPPGRTCIIWNMKLLEPVEDQ